MKTFSQHKKELQSLDESNYDLAIKFFIDYHKKHGGDVQQNLVKTARIVKGINYRTLERVLHDLINRKMVDRKYGFRKDMLK